MTVRVLEIPGIPTPEGGLRWLDDPRTGFERLGHDLVDLGFRAHVVGKTETRWTSGLKWKPRVGSQACARPDRKFEAVLKLEEGNGTNLELGPHDPAAGQAESVSVERYRPIEVFDAKRDEADIWTHRVCGCGF